MDERENGGYGYGEGGYYGGGAGGFGSASGYGGFQNLQEIMIPVRKNTTCI